MYTTQINTRTRAHACRYPGCMPKPALADRAANFLLCSASTVGIITALFFLLTL